MIRKLTSLFKKGEEPCSNQLCETLNQNQEETLWLLLSRKNNSPDLTFYDMCRATLHKIKLPESILKGGRCFCVGSGHGWLALDNHYQIFLFDPVSGHHIALPPFKDKELINRNINLVRLSISPDAASFTVAATLDDNSLAICSRSESSEDEGWNIIKGLGDDQVFLTDILFSSDGKTMYASLMCEYGYEFPPRVVQTHTISLAGGQAIVLKLLPDYTDLRYPRPDPADDLIAKLKKGETVDAKDRVAMAQYLVKSSDGEVLTVYGLSNVLVTASWDNEDADYPETQMTYYPTRRFDVERFELTGDVATMTTLTDLGDRALFVSQGESFLVSTEKYSGFKRNCIYFLDGKYYCNDQYFTRESGVFSIKDEKINRFLPSHDIDKECSQMWFLPNLKSGSSINISIH